MALTEPARSSVEQRLELRRRQRWPTLRDLKVRYRGDYACVSGTGPDGPLSLCRFRGGFSEALGLRLPPGGAGGRAIYDNRGADEQGSEK